MVELQVNTSIPYKILIEKNLINHINEKLKFLQSDCKILIVTDKNVKKFHLNNLIDQLKNINFKIFTFVVPFCEKSKSFKYTKRIYNYLSRHDFSRSDCILALGGGVVGDLAGFAASTFLRGIPFVNVPTSLLSQVDSAVGGKTGINTPYGKNLVGSFYSPKLVLIDPNLISTLPSCEISNGFSEIIKYALIKDKDLFLKLKNCSKQELLDDLEDIITKCVLIKKEIVEKDEFDKSSRMVLNFGHTLGHAIEKLGKFKKYSHGQAISIGMKKIVEACVKNNVLDRSLKPDLEFVLKKFSLPSSCAFDKNEIILASLNDKKFFDNKFNIVLISSIGNSYIQKFTKEEFEKFLI